jgi:Tol biopolymer transport system component
MGEVWRAKDVRLGRDVAVKVLPDAFRQNPDWLLRFEREARAAGALNHPNILSIYDVGTHEDSPYTVAELLEGQTLRERLQQGPVSVRKAIDIGAQIARGLAAAHQKGITHRDLKPENIFLTRDGGVKILDFGLAKLAPAFDAGAAAGAELAPTLPPEQTPPPSISLRPGVSGQSGPAASLRTTPGVMMGTVGYAAPEQLRGQEADARSDLFAFGAILYEMLLGERAFARSSTADAVSAILHDEPPGFERLAQLHPGIERLVRRCLEKDPDDRFHSARDLAFDLEASVSNTSGIRVPVAERAGIRWPPVGVLAAFGAAVALVGAGAYAVGRSHAHAVAAVAQPASAPADAMPTFLQLTYRRGIVFTARFAQDGSSIVYSASWEGDPDQVFELFPGGAESRPISDAGTDLFAVSSKDDLALSLARRATQGWDYVGTLARQPLGGGAPRQVQDDVHYADFAPDGSEMVLVFADAGKYRLVLYPEGKVLYETAGWISHPRFSPRGDAIAFLDHPWPEDDRGNVAVIDLQGKRTTLSEGWASVQGLAWSLGGSGHADDEIWFTASSQASHALYAVSLAGTVRTVLRVPGSLTLEDIASDGRVLLTRDDTRHGMMALAPGSDKERDLSWFDWSLPDDLSPDGTKVIFTEEGDPGGTNYTVFMRPTDGSPAVRLGDGGGGGLSPDGKSVLSATLAPDGVALLPVGAGSPRTITDGSLAGYAAPSWLPDGKHIVYGAHQGDQASRLWIQDLDGGAPRPITPEGVVIEERCVSPDGSWAFVGDPSGNGIWLYPLGATGQPHKLAGTRPGEEAVGWGADGKWVYISHPNQVTLKIDRLNIQTGSRQPWKEIPPADPAGVLSANRYIPSSDGKSYVYSYHRQLSDLYLVTGLH